MYKTINGWTKASMIEFIQKNFKGKSIASADDAVYGSSFCAYRGYNGKKCAVGLFIPDSLYSINMEKQCAENVLKVKGLKDIMPLCIAGMEELQTVHDGSKAVDTMTKMLNWIENNVEDYNA